MTVQNEVDAFFMLIFVCVKMQWRDVYRDGMIKIMQMQRLLNIVTKKEDKVYKHLLKLCDNDEDIIFTN